MGKLAFSTLPCEDWELQTLIAFGSGCGYTGIELREGLLGIDARLPAAERKSLDSSLKRAGLAVTNIGSSVCIRGSRQDRIDNTLREVSGLCRLAADLSATGVRIFLGNFARRKDEFREDIDYRLIVEGVKACCDIAQSFGVEIWIESHNEFATGKSLYRLLEDTDKPNCRVIWDILHPLEDGEAPSETMNYLAQACAHVHIKDGLPFDDPGAHDWKYTPIGQGQAPIAEIVGLLKRNGFKGYYSLEWETKWREELRVPGSEPKLVLGHYVNYMTELFRRLD